MIDKNTAKSILKKYVPNKIKSIARVREGESSTVYRIIVSDHEIYYFKQGDNNYKIQYKLHEKLNKLGIKTPPIVDFSDRWLILKGVEGHELDFRVKIEPESLADFGEQVALIHSLKTEYYGPLVSTTKGKFKTYTDYYRKLDKYINVNYLGLIQDYLSKNHDTNLNHGDLFLSHVYVDRDGKYISLIDWDDIISAPGKCDLGEFLSNVNNNGSVWNSFMKGYAKHRDYIYPEDKELLIEELLQIYSSYYWLINEYPKNINKIKMKKNKIGNIQQRLKKYI